MKKVVLLMVFGLLWHGGYTQQLFQKQFTLGYESYLNDVVECETDSSYYFVGTIKYIDTGSFVFKPFILKTDKWGNLAWCKIILLSPLYAGYTVFNRIIKSHAPNEFIIIGFNDTLLSNQYIFKSFILSVDTAGVVSVAKQFNVTNRDYFYDIIPTLDGGYATLGGVNVDYTYNTGKILMLKLDGQLNQQWAKIYGDTAYNFGESIIQLPDSCFMISGTTHKYDDLDPDAFVTRTDANGNQTWFKILKDTVGEGARSQLAYTLDSNVVLAYNSIQPFGDVVYFLKMDTLGSIFWQRAMGFTNLGSFTQYKKSTDGGFLFCEGRIWKVDSTGNHVWVQPYNASNQAGAARFNLTHDAGLILAGHRGLSLRNMYIQKADSVAYSVCAGTIINHFNYPVSIFNFDNDLFPDSAVTFNQTLLNSVAIDSIPLETVFCSNVGLNASFFYYNNVQVFPIPVSDLLKIEFNNSDVGSYSIELSDITGKILLSKNSESNITTEINMVAFNSGLYLLKIFNIENIIIKKVIKQ